MLTPPDAPSKNLRGLRKTIVSQLTKPVKQSDLMDAILNASTRGKLEPGGAPGAIESAARRARRLRVLLADDNRTNQRLVELFSEPSATRSRR